MSISSSLNAGVMGLNVNAARLSTISGQYRKTSFDRRLQAQPGRFLEHGALSNARHFVTLAGGVRG